MPVNISFKGQNELERALKGLEAKIPGAVGAALRAEAEIEMTEAKARTPVDTGALRGSGRVSGPDIETSAGGSADVTVKLEFGNASVDYAFEVHENLEAFHKVGQAKYLESVLTESAPHLPARIAKRIGDAL